MIPTEQQNHFDCRDVFERLYEYLDRALDPEDEEAVRAHLALCEDCLRHFRFEEELLARIRSRLRSARAPATLRDRLSRLMDRL